MYEFQGARLTGRQPRREAQPGARKEAATRRFPPQTDGVLILLACPLPVSTSWCS